MSNNDHSFIYSAVQRDVKQIMDGIYAFLGKRFSLDELYLYTQCFRQRTLVIEDHNHASLSAEVNGYSIVLADVDYIAIRAGINPFLRITTIAHEIGHLLAGHHLLHYETLTQFQRHYCPIDAQFRDGSLLNNVYCESVANLLETLIVESLDAAIIDDSTQKVWAYFGGEYR
ncbi:hypothetical protein [Herpetosiphon gulosus]|uniref:IrrE N-terminal-like domain-containing protein n=1 Tax=Herpetosiphon gulosus TaxID=1973496 RepID=A0ABP9X5W9_9CHLR